LPSMKATMSSTVGFGVTFSRPTADSTIPGVQ
jgi:hypothetical protein